MLFRSLAGAAGIKVSPSLVSIFFSVTRFQSLPKLRASRGYLVCDCFFAHSETIDLLFDVVLFSGVFLSTIYAHGQDLMSRSNSRSLPQIPRNVPAVVAMIFVLRFYPLKPEHAYAMISASGLETAGGKDDTKKGHEQTLCPVGERPELFKYV